MRTNPMSAIDAERASRAGKPLRAGVYEGTIREASEHISQRGNDTIELEVAVTDRDGNERLFRDWLVATPRSAAKLRNACEAVGALARYDAGEISANDFPGHACRVRIGIEKKRGFPDRNVILDYEAAATRAVPLRGVAS
jgi:hypothetical protein